MTQMVVLTLGQVALIDDRDLTTVSGIKWHAHTRSDRGYYARGYIQKARRTGNRYVYMHDLILGVKGADHRDGNGLDNRRRNIRPANQSQNNANAMKRKGTTSRFKGVHYDKSRRQWKSEITLNQRNRYIGRFSTEIEAAIAYNKAAARLFGSYARLNDVKPLRLL